MNKRDFFKTLEDGIAELPQVEQAKVSRSPRMFTTKHYLRPAKPFAG